MWMCAMEACQNHSLQSTFHLQFPNFCLKCTSVRIKSCRVPAGSFQVQIATKQSMKTHIEDFIIEVKSLVSHSGSQYERCRVRRTDETDGRVEGKINRDDRLVLEKKEQEKVGG